MADKEYAFGEVLISEEQLAERIAELGKEITADFAGEEVLMVGILKGSVPFLADLIRKVDLDVKIDFMSVSSYGASTKSSGVVRILKDLDTGVEGRNVIIVEDIVDSGLTLQYLKEYLSGRKPKSLKICTLLDKPEGRKVEIQPDYKCFTVGNQFIVGFGLDYDQKYRNLPYISCLVEK
ncbi:hypoxanthine phosphoribosyltransferase [Bacilliculturomica massiliensis]|uniref:hypoxanthine phosphoribosyltransferase n=1 Tax=Bacilliculturomica massiliensis TaxID=1917867 RepID=UPI001030B72B|nr:hypoxanthine phosphoribosyltransferase [Bacilliculturomica massiliensis]